MVRYITRERGVALITVLLFVVLVFILITAMLSVSGNEIFIAGSQRDSVGALDLAQAGLQEAVVRIQNGRPFRLGFTSALNPGVSVSVVQRQVGSNSAYLEIQSTATVGRATRRLSELALQRLIMFPPNIMFGSSLAPQGENVKTGDVYAQYGVFYESALWAPSTTFTYAGWRIKYWDGSTGLGLPCYNRTQAGCSGTPPSTVNWYPGTRWTVSQSSPDGLDLLSQTTKCAAGGGGSLPTPPPLTGVLASAVDGNADGADPSPPLSTVAVYGFDTDNPGVGPQAVTSALPCGLPYKYVSVPIKGEIDTGDATKTFTRLVKEVVFEQWFANYWTFDPVKMTYVKNPSLVSYPQFGAIPPSTTPSSMTASTNYNAVLSGGGAVTQTSTDWGCKQPEMGCVPPFDRPVAILLDGTPGVTNWTISGVLNGHGTLVVNGNLAWASAGTFTYWGTIIVNGKVDNSMCLCAPAPNTIYGGLVSTQPYILNDATQIYGGGSVSSIPAGPSIVTGKAWWER